MHFRVALVLIDVVDCAADARQQSQRTADRRQDAARERVVECVQRHFGACVRLAEPRRP